MEFEVNETFWSIKYRLWSRTLAVRSKRHVPDSKIHGANMGPTWVLSAPDGPHVGPMNFAIRGSFQTLFHGKLISYYLYGFLEPWMTYQKITKHHWLILKVDVANCLKLMIDM